MGFPVRVASIEGELERLWRDSYEAARDDEGEALTRACQLNLVITCDGAEEARHAREVAAGFMRLRPCRIIMTVVDPAAPAEMTAMVSAHCSAAGETGAPQVCCEEITLTGTSGSIDRLAATALPLLLPDLPVVVWNPGDFRPMSRGPGGDLVRSVLKAAGRVVVDSCRFTEPPERYRDLVRGGSKVFDLSWERLRGWRETTATLFDAPRVAGNPARFDSIDTIEAEYGGEGKPSGAEAFLLSAWAADRLDWRPSGLPRRQKEGTWVCPSSRASGAPCRVALRRDPRQKRPGVSSLRLSAGDVAWSVTREGSDLLKSSIVETGASPIEHMARLVERDKTTLLCRAIDGGTDQIYEQALRMALMLYNQEPKESRP